MRFRAVVAGDRYSCGVTVTDFGYCWGRNVEGQLGAGLSFIPSRLEPTAVRGGFRFQEIAVGSGATCGIVRDASVYCWGATGWNEVYTYSYQPMVLWPGLTYSSVSMGNRRMCAVDGDGVTICSGHIYEPQELDWDETGVNSFYIGPVPFFTSYPLRSLTVGDGHTCGLSEGGSATCWGVNILGSWETGLPRPRWTSSCRIRASSQV